jgi:hypothetical protein
MSKQITQSELKHNPTIIKNVKNQTYIMVIVANEIFQNKLHRKIRCRDKFLYELL